jgi:hypothetical protein
MRMLIFTHARFVSVTRPYRGDTPGPELRQGADCFKHVAGARRAVLGGVHPGFTAHLRRESHTSQWNKEHGHSEKIVKIKRKSI